MKDRAKALADLGNEIRTIRKEKGFTLDDVTAVTKIRTNFLEDIENGVLDNFPGSVYVRGFIKSYLRFLGAEDLWPQFKPYIFSEEIVGAPDLVLGTCTPPARGFRQASRLWMIIVLLMIIAGFGWYGWSAWTNRDESYQGIQKIVSSEEEVVATVEEKISEPSNQVKKEESSLVISSDEGFPKSSGDTFSTSVTVSGDESLSITGMTDASGEIKPDIALSAGPIDNSQPNPVIKSEPEIKNILVISTTRDCWVKLSGPENTIFQGVIKGNASREFEITERTEVVYGRPGSVSISFRGEDLGNPGKGGSVEHWFYSPDGSKGRINN